MSKPKIHNDDLLRLDRNYQLAAVVGRETIIIVVGATVIADLAAIGRQPDMPPDQIDAKGGEHPFRRAMVICDQAWFDNRGFLGSKAVIAVGGPKTNKLTAEFDQQRDRANRRNKVLNRAGSSGFYQKGESFIRK